MERRARQEDACLVHARSGNLARASCQYSRARWLLIAGLLVSACMMLLGTLGVAPFAAPLHSIGRHFNHASTGDLILRARCDTWGRCLITDCQMALDQPPQSWPRMTYSSPSTATSWGLRPDFR